MLRNKFITQGLLAVLLLSSTVFCFAAGKLVVVMDDLGNQQQSGLQAVAVPWVTTVAIMPGRPFSTELAEAAHRLGKEVIIHAPMSNSIDFPLGPLGLDRELGEAQLRDHIRQSLDSVPYAVGLSNHMGSRLTQDAEAMGWVMAELKQLGLYFFDSRTVSTTVGWEVAEQQGIPWSMRDVFLDHHQDREFLTRQWQQALRRIAAGENINVICHPYPETLAFFDQLPMSELAALNLTPLSHVLTNFPMVVLQRRNDQEFDN